MTRRTVTLRKPSRVSKPKRPPMVTKIPVKAEHWVVGNQVSIVMMLPAHLRKALAGETDMTVGDFACVKETGADYRLTGPKAGELKLAVTITLPRSKPPAGTPPPSGAEDDGHDHAHGSGGPQHGTPHLPINPW